MKIDKNSLVPRYAQLKSILLKMLETDNIAPGNKIPSENELVARFDISRPTIRHAISELINEGILYREKGVGTFVADRYQPKKTRSIGLILPYTEGSFEAEITLGVEHILYSNNYTLIFCNSGNNPVKERDNINRLRKKGVEGLIILPCEAEKSYKAINELKNSDFPFILIDRYLPQLKTDYVVSDNYNGAYRAVSYLIQQGHEKIGLGITPGRNITPIRDRIEGYKDALRDNGIKDTDIPTAKLIPEGSYIMDIPEEQRVDTVRNFLDHNKISAVVASNDLVALDIYRAIKQMGLSIPQDISVVGFDDLSTSSVLTPPLTTIAQPKYELGKKAATVLLEMIHGERDKQSNLVLPTELVIRGSVAANDKG
ncbi:MAG: GntR family transcriptional regulator [bacterium]|nr:GntR family transcriptional regulator [bacterium]